MKSDVNRLWVRFYGNYRLPLRSWNRNLGINQWH